MISPLWLDGPLQGKEQAVSEMHISSGYFIWRVAKLPQDVIGYWDYDKARETTPVLPIDDFIYRFYPVRVFGRTVILASCLETTYGFDREDVLNSLDSTAAEVLLSDRAKKASIPK